MNVQWVRHVFIIACLLAAVTSCGRKTGADEPELSDEAAFDRREKLTTCSVYSIDEHRPDFETYLDEGDISLYGLLLVANPDPELAQKLYDANVGGLWEYQRRYGVTTEDCALVIEGLLAAGTDKKLLADAVIKLKKIGFYRESEGCFLTVVGKGRSAYWRGCSVETNAHIAYCMGKIEPRLFAREIESIGGYVASRQQPDGGWKGRWFPSLIIPTYYAIRFLATFGERYRQNLNKGVLYLEKNQKSDGSWNNSIIDTSAALLALAVAGPGSSALPAGRAWLSRQNTGEHREAVQYYWFDDGTARRFFDCWDRGRIARAWLTTALKNL